MLIDRSCVSSLSGLVQQQQPQWNRQLSHPADFMCPSSISKFSPDHHPVASSGATPTSSSSLLFDSGIMDSGGGVNQQQQQQMNDAASFAFFDAADDLMGAAGAGEEEMSVVSSQISQLLSTNSPTGGGGARRNSPAGGADSVEGPPTGSIVEEALMLSGQDLEMLAVGDPGCRGGADDRMLFTVVNFCSLLDAYD